MITTVAVHGLLALLLVAPAFQPTTSAEAPIVKHSGINTLAKGEDLRVEATVTGTRPIARVRLSYRMGERFGDVALSRAGTSTWSARVPAARFTGSFSYIIHATDELGRAGVWPASPAGHPVTLTDPVPPPANRHLLYVATPGVRNYVEYGGAGILVYDVAKGHTFVKRIPTLDVPAGQDPENVKGVALSVETGLLYVTTPRRMYAVDIKTERIVWNREYEGGCDRMALAPDGKVLYVPSFEGPHWHVVDGKTGDVIARLEPKSGAHNTIYGLDGKEVYLAGLASPILHVADAKTHTISKKVGPFTNMIRPFTVNGSQTLCFVNVNGLLGFEVGDLRSGKMLHRVEVKGFDQGPVKRHSCPSHGIGLTPDESELWLTDSANSRLHIFDATAMPPRQLTSLKVRDQPGWITFSLDGRYAYPSTGEIIDVKTRKTVATLSDELGRAVQSEKVVEAIFEGGRLVRAGDQFGIGRKR